MSVLEADAPSTTVQDMILDHVYRAFRFNPNRDRKYPVRARLAFGVASMLLKDEAKIPDCEIARAISYPENAVAGLIAYAEQLAKGSSETRELILKVKDDVCESRETVRTIGLIEQHAEEPPIIILTEATDMASIGRIVSRILEVSLDKMQGPGKKAHETDARQIAMTIGKSLRPNRSLSELGRHLGGRHTSTTLSAVRKIADVVRNPTARSNKRTYGKVLQVCRGTNLTIEQFIVEI